ncbi:MAG: hypothetical protein KJP00_01720 [Bacteroidia bacterium]|nr:hypothetical protein [Bacteroidia bacterium]
MIKFFRNIRQNMLSENKFSKYLLYAIGEIVLVVIGILIALQINNWNIKNQALIEIDSNFQNLIEDVNSNKLQLLNLIKERENVYRLSEMLLDTYERKEKITENIFMKAFIPSLHDMFFEIDRNGIDKVISSSAFEINELESIRDLIKSYLKDTNILKTWESKENLAIENMEMITAGNGYFKSIWKSLRKARFLTTDTYDNPDFNFLKMMENDEIRYIMLRTEFIVPSAIRRYNNLIEKGDLIIDEIENYKSSK